MSAAASYPATRYEPSPLVDLNAKAERERLSPAAIRTFFNIAERWGIRDEDARLLPGGVSHGPYHAMTGIAERVLDADPLLRIPYLIGIFKALNPLYSEKPADSCV